MIILKNKTDSVLPFTVDCYTIFIPANSSYDLSQNFRYEQLRISDQLISLLGKGEEYYQLNDGVKDLINTDAIRLILGITEESLPRQPDGVPKFAESPRDGSEWVIGTHNFCDPTTWFGDSIRVNNEVLVDS